MPLELNAIMDWWFGGDEPAHPITLFQTCARAVVVYVAGLLVVRVGKGRMVGRVTSLDILMGFILGSLLSRGITGHASLSSTVVASVSLAAVHWIFTGLAVKWRFVGSLLKGHSVMLVRDGETLDQNMRNSHISKNDLMEELRLHGVENLANVRYAYKERNGQISVIRRDEPAGPSDIEK